MSDFASIVGKHWRRTTGYVVTGHEPCISIGSDEIRHVERRLVHVRLAGVRSLRPTASWFMAVLVCPGDDLTGLAQWATAVDAERVHFYLHARARAAQLAPWRDAGHPLESVEEGIRSWAALHKVLGWDLNLQVYDDHRGP